MCPESDPGDRTTRGEEDRDRQPDAPRRSERGDVLTLSVLSLFVIGFGVWLVFAGTRYREEYAQATEGWRLGSTRMLEISLKPGDSTSLACASDQVIAGLRCGSRADRRPAGPVSPEDPHLLQPYNTIKHELFLGAGLWSSLNSKPELPNHRFTVVCNYHIKGVIKSAWIRFSTSHPYQPLTKTITVGTLTDCMIPR